MTVLLTGVLAVAGCGAEKGPQVATARTAEPAPTGSAAAGGELATYVEGMRNWVKCLRGEGIQVSDPDAMGDVTFPDLLKQKADPRFIAAQQKCNGVRPAVPESVEKAKRPKMTPQQIDDAKRYAKCMQDSGAPDFPDPDPEGYFPDEEWKQDTPNAQAALRKCLPILGPTTDPTGAQG
jgi:hypothetical protein